VGWGGGPHTVMRTADVNVLLVHLYTALVTRGLKQMIYYSCSLIIEFEGQRPLADSVVRMRMVECWL